MENFLEKHCYCFPALTTGFSVKNCTIFGNIWAKI
jgi:hypothetical protein